MSLCLKCVMTASSYVAGVIVRWQPRDYVVIEPVGLVGLRMTYEGQTDIGISVVFSTLEEEAGMSQCCLLLISEYPIAPASEPIDFLSTSILSLSDCITAKIKPSESGGLTNALVNTSCFTLYTGRWSGLSQYN